MNLSFKTEINGKPTYFPEKIMASMPLDVWAYIYTVVKYENRKHFKQLSEMMDNYIYLSNRNLIKPKIHTIRQDPKHRWNAGNKIHFVINNRTPQRLQFAPVVECVSVQTILINPQKASVGVLMIDKDGNESNYIKPLGYNSQQQLAINDGFDSLDDFWAFFEQYNYFTGKIIHWTNKIY